MTYYPIKPPRGGYPKHTDALGKLYGDPEKQPEPPKIGNKSPVAARKRSGRAKSYTPTEHTVQTALCDWLDLQHPEVLYYAIPNGGKRGWQARTRATAEGLKAGVPDLCLCEARGGWHGLYIELKRAKRGRVSAEQIVWIESLRQRVYQAEICFGFEHAQQVIDKYLRMSKWA